MKKSGEKETKKCWRMKQTLVKKTRIKNDFCEGYFYATGLRCCFGKKVGQLCGANGVLWFYLSPLCKECVNVCGGNTSNMCVNCFPWLKGAKKYHLCSSDASAKSFIFGTLYWFYWNRRRLSTRRTNYSRQSIFLRAMFAQLKSNNMWWKNYKIILLMHWRKIPVQRGKQVLLRRYWSPSPAEAMESELLLR